jgi:hypothetical protein
VQILPRYCIRWSNAERARTVQHGSIDLMGQTGPTRLHLPERFGVPIELPVLTA